MIADTESQRLERRATGGTGRGLTWPWASRPQPKLDVLTRLELAERRIELLAEQAARHEAEVLRLRLKAGLL